MLKVPKLDIELNGIKYDHDFSRDIKIDRTDLESEFATQAERFVYYSFLSEEAKYLCDRKKATLENLYALIDAERRANAAALMAGGAKLKYTETMYKNETLGDPRYKEALEEYHKAKLLSGQLENAAKGIAMRKDMLMQMGASARVSAGPQRVLNQAQTARDIIGRNQ